MPAYRFDATSGALLPLDGARLRRSGWERSWRWQRLSRAVVARDGHRCRECGTSPGPGNPLTADHVTSIAGGGGVWDPGNLQCLCLDCNARKGA